MNNKDYFMYLREVELQEQIEQERLNYIYRNEKVNKEDKSNSRLLCLDRQRTNQSNDKIR